MSDSSSGGSAGSNLVFFLLGAAVGASVALLYAPQEGEKTRRLIGEKATDVRDKATEVSSTVATTARETYGTVRDRAQDVLNQAQEVLNKAQRLAHPAAEEGVAAPGEAADNTSPA